METRQAEHQKLTDEQIKETICDLTVELHEIKEFVKELIDYVEVAEYKIYQLKRHFCPEKFQEVKVSGATLNELLEQAYFTDKTGKTQRMGSNEE